MDKKFVLSSSDKKIAGVCGGIAEYFGVDTLLVRIAFVLCAVIGSLSFWVYLLLWLLAPKSK